MIDAIRWVVVVVEVWWTIKCNLIMINNSHSIVTKEQAAVDWLFIYS